MTQRRTILVVLVALVVLSCTPGIVKPTQSNIKQVIKFDDEIYFHNVGIAWNGKNYYTLNGGNKDYGKVNTYDRNGELKGSAKVTVDGRAIFYSPAKKKFYVKGYSQDLQSYNPKLHVVRTEAAGVFHDEQSSPALSPDGKTMFELSGGTLYIMDFPGMAVRKMIEEFSDVTDANATYNSVIAAGRDYLFTWSEDGTVVVYDHDGKHVSDFQLKTGLYAKSLTWANGMLWGAEDADGRTEGGTGTWYGYSLGPGVK